MSQSVRPASSGRTRHAARCHVKLLYSLSSLPLMFASPPTLACTLCHSRTAEQVRAAVSGADFMNNLVAISAPILALFITALAVRKYIL